MKVTIIIFCQSWQYSWVDIEQFSQHVVLKQLDPYQRKKINQNYYKRIINLNMKT